MFRIAARLLALIVGLGLASPFVRAQKSVDAEGHPWWQHSVFYEIYPRSFMDSNGDGYRRPERHRGQAGLSACAGSGCDLDRALLPVAPG